jgi:hypothetical protein
MTAVGPRDRARLEAGWALWGNEALVLRNRRLRVVVLPGLGGKVWEFHDLARGVQHLWHNPRVKPKRAATGAPFDDQFAGGWDELFPNDAPEVLAGEAFPDHGELWSAEWDWHDRSDQMTARLELCLDTPISGCRVRKTLILGPEDRHLTVMVELTNGGPRELPCLWKQHLALPAAPGSAVCVPAVSGIMEDFGNPRAGRPGDRFAWPVADGPAGPVDLGLTPPLGALASEFMYLMTPDQGWCAVCGPSGEGVALAYDTAVFPTCWIFASYGGWRGLSVVVLEPCTGYPVSVARGVADGTHRTLAPGEAVETRLALIPFAGLSRVTDVTRRGGSWRVRGEPWGGSAGAEAADEEAGRAD